MSNLGRSLGMFALAVLTLTVALAAPAFAQVSAIKDGWLVMKIHSEFVDEDVLERQQHRRRREERHGHAAGHRAERSRARPRHSVGEEQRRRQGRHRSAEIAPASHDGGKMDKAQDKAAKAADKAEDKMDKAGDKTASAAKKTGRAIDDGWIKSKIYAQYMADWNTVLDDSDIDIDVQNNMVTLNGTVKSAEAKAKAVSIAKATDGVKGVKDNLRVAATR